MFHNYYNTESHNFAKHTKSFHKCSSLFDDVLLNTFDFATNRYPI